MERLQLCGNGVGVDPVALDVQLSRVRVFTEWTFLNSMWCNARVTTEDYTSRERDKRDKKGEDGIVDLISPSPGDELCRTASIIINEKRRELFILFIIVKNQFHFRIWPCIYRGKRISKWSAQNTADVKKRKRERQRKREREDCCWKRQRKKSLESRMSIFLLKNKSCKFPKAQSRYKFNESISFYIGICSVVHFSP